MNQEEKPTDGIQRVENSVSTWLFYQEKLLEQNENSLIPQKIRCERSFCYQLVSKMEFCNMTNVVFQFIMVMRDFGLEPPENILPGRMYRFPGAGKKKGTAGWCILFEDGRGGSFGDWVSGLSEKWFHNSNKFHPKDEIKIAQKRVEFLEKRENEKNCAALKAREIIRNSSNAPENFLYLQLKRISSQRVRFSKGSLVLPIFNFREEIVNIQFIKPNGQKRFLKGGEKQGCYIPIQCANGKVHRIAICEGWATGVTIAEIEKHAIVAAAIDAGNLLSVGLRFRIHYPNAEIYFYADDDRLVKGNPGLSKANEAAFACKGKVIRPPWPPNAPVHLTDFNDLVCWLQECEAAKNEQD